MNNFVGGKWKVSEVTHKKKEILAGRCEKKSISRERMQIVIQIRNTAARESERRNFVFRLIELLIKALF